MAEITTDYDKRQGFTACEMTREAEPLAVDPLVPVAAPPARPPVDPAVVAGQIGAAWGAWLLKARRAASPHAAVYASAWRPCDRRMALELTAPDQQPPFEAPVLARFRRGDDRERDLLADLARIGRDADPPFEIIGQQEKFTLRDRKGRPAIVGKVDARIHIGGACAPLEVKAWAPGLVDRIETFADLFDNPWTRGGGYQLLSYLWGAEEPFGFLLLDRSGLPLIVPVELDAHLDRMEEFLSKAERVLDHVAAGTLPDFYPEAVECKRCPFYGGGCNPPLAADVVRVLTDPELEAALERWHALTAAGKEWAALDADVKRRLRGVEAGVAGAFLDLGHLGERLAARTPGAPQKAIHDHRGAGAVHVDDRAARIMTYDEREIRHLHCTECGKQVSTGFVPVPTDTPDRGLIVRAWIQCPECVIEGATRGPSR